MVDSRKGLDEAGLFESCLRSQCFQIDPAPSNHRNTNNLAGTNYRAGHSNAWPNLLCVLEVSIRISTSRGDLPKTCRGDHFPV
jgi:hypothetical protein